MDAPEADTDIKLHKISADLIADFDRTLPSFLWKSDGRGGSRVRSRVRSRETARLANMVLDPFQELPQLLDPYLPKWIPLLAEAYLKHLQTRRRERTLSSRSDLLVSVEYAICKILYTFCKIRGEKVVVRFLNVETKYLELLLSAIEESEQHNGAGDSLTKWMWEERYIVLLWISHLLYAPFDLSTISSVDLQDLTAPEIPGLKWPEALPGITVRLIPLAIKYLATPGKERDAAKALLVRMATRRDMQQLGVLDSLIHWSLASLRHEKDKPLGTTYFYLGVLSFLAGVLRSSSETSDLNPYLSSIFYAVHAIAINVDDLSKTIVSFALARKMILKVIRSVVVLLLRQNPQDMASTELTETAIGYLLESSSDNDTPVRLAASKSLSIVTLKLDPDMASQVVEAVLESLNRNVLWKKSEGARPVRDLSAVNNLEWHGLMLTLSHLLYRRSPPAEQLSDIVHALLLGLSFEQRSMSGGSIGSNVRDAACFGVWAIARRYSTEELLTVPTQSVFAAKAHPSTSSILQVLGTELVVAACTDPAGNIRRGASAALQELIGRHPNTIEQGIWVVQAVDYHAVARRSRAIEEVALATTKLSGQYGEAIIDTLLDWRGIGDLDAPSRRACGAAFGVLTSELSGLEAGDLLSRFRTSIDQLTSRLSSLQKRQVEERHGLLVSFASVLDKLAEAMKKSDAEFDGALINKIITSTTEVLKDLAETVYRRPELIAEAASKFVVSVVPIAQVALLGSACRATLRPGCEFLSPTDTSGVLDLVATLDKSENSRQEVADLVVSLRSVIPAWLSRNEIETIEFVAPSALALLTLSSPKDRTQIIQEWAQTLSIESRNSNHGDGYFHALAMAQPLAQNPEVDIASQAILNRWTRDKMVETRVAILQSLVSSRLLQNKVTVFLQIIEQGLNDYTTTARGDIGSLVRVQALRAVKSLWSTLGSTTTTDWMEASIRALFFSTLRLSAEKLDRVRTEAQAAISLAWQEGIHADRFRELTFSSKAYLKTLVELRSLDCLHPLVRDLAVSHPEEWTCELMAGFVTSADTGNEDLVIASRAALSDYCQASQENLDLIARALLQNLKTRLGQDRVIVPTLEIVAYLFHVGLLQRSSVNFRSLCVQTQKAGFKTGNVRKLEACTRVYGGIASMGRQKGAEAGVQEARKRLGVLLSHRWPRVRSVVADELWGLGDKEDTAEHCLLGKDLGQASKEQIKTIVEELQLG